MPIILGGLGGGGGGGVLVDQDQESVTFMRVKKGEWGLGFGTRNFGTLLIFEDRETLERFGGKGWEFGSGADAAAKTGNTGAAGGASMALVPGIRIYEMTTQVAA